MYTGAAQYDDPQEYPVNKACEGIDGASEGTDTLGRIFSGIVALRWENSCHDVDEFLSDETLDSSWGWQTIEYMNSGNKSYRVAPIPHWITTYYGSHCIRVVVKRFGSNLIFSNGFRDPYSSAGVLEDISDSIIAVVTKNGSHCLDIQPATEDDPECSSSEKTSVSKNVVNSEEFTIEDFNKAIDNWDLPKSQPRFSTSDIPSSSIHSVDYATSVPHPIYTSSQHEKRQEEKKPSPPTSPTFSAVTENIIESNPITVRRKATEWNLSGSGRVIESEHPPLRSITIDHGESPLEIKASPYKIHKDPETDLDSIIQQNNFSKPVTSKSDSDKKLKEPIFKPFQVSKTSQKLVHESKSDFAKAIREQLDRIEAASSSSSKVQIAPDSAQSSKIGVLEQDSMSIASSDVDAFTEEPVPKANKIHWELALHTVKSPPDLAIDNRPSALNQSRFNASSIYEWNIDGMSEYNILGLLQQMTMAANAYKTQLGTSDKAIAEILIAGFTGQLKGEKVKNSIKALYDNRIPYDELAYGELVSFINKEGLKICQDLKLQKQLKWELRKSKQELGSFCKQFNYDPFKSSTSKDCNGHTAKFCRMSRKLHELGLDEELFSKIAPLLVESSDSESSMSGDSEPLQIDELIDSDTSVTSDGDSDTDSYLKKINVLTKEQKTFLELVKHISDPTLQKEYLDKLLKTLDLNNKTETPKAPIIKKSAYDLTEILDKKKTKKTTPNIQDLQKEIKDIKLEIKDLKEKQKTDSETIQLLLQKQLQDNSDKESDDGDNEE
ncbi:hypothetical protein KPL71_011689 [Citrus sinensis]|uniref:Uncharacterized protein n=1 Tax=Citrus sinensis TaxID=2711 RepID=A0ACB8L5D7_CITSI|nr:hypothetical protein KPL71_011689 [Citrus sinensis]